MKKWVWMDYIKLNIIKEYDFENIKLIKSASICVWNELCSVVMVGGVSLKNKFFCFRTT